jgi:replication-associated recombination protein RarA
VRGYGLSDVASALQKACRRGDARVAGYFAIEMMESGYGSYAWRRLLTVSAEDCAGIITQEIKALYDSWVVVQRATPPKGRHRRVFLAKAVVLLCQAKKSRDADHLSNLIYDPRALHEDVIDKALTEARKSKVELPDYTFDCHTGAGIRAGKTKRDFFIAEFDALTPRAPGLFDDDLEQVRRGKRQLVDRKRGK